MIQCVKYLKEIYEITVCIMDVILQSRCFHMNNRVPNFQVSIDVRLIDIKTVS